MPSILRAAWRVVVQRSIADWLVVAAAWLVILLAVTLLAAGVMYADAVASSGLHRLLADSPVDEANVELSLSVPGSEIDEVDAVVRDEARRALRATGGRVLRVARSGSFALPGQEPDEVRDLTVLTNVEEITAHGDLVEGAWPATGAEPVEAAISAPAAQLLDLAVGDELALTVRAGADLTVDVRVAGIFRVEERTDPYWFAEPLALDGLVEGESFDTYGPFVVSLDDLRQRLGERRIDLTWRLLPDFERLDID
jgi:predicted lysophospholipase L1 biosynthesis ABC-type transport system permease subunit